MDLIDEKYNFSLGLYHFIYDSFQPFLKFAFIFGTGNQCPHIERIYLFRFQILGYISPHDTMRQSFGNGSLSGSRFSDEDRIVFGTTAQYLQYPTYLIITTDDRIEFSRTRPFIQIYGIFAQ